MSKFDQSKFVDMLMEKREKLELGSVPADERCAQVGVDNYEERARRECRAYIAQLNRHYERANDGLSLPCQLVIVSNRHDYGTYYEVAAKFNPQKGEEVDAAFWLEHNAPTCWDDDARSTLGLDKDQLIQECRDRAQKAVPLELSTWITETKQLLTKVADILEKQ